MRTSAFAVALAALALAGSVHADTQTYGFTLSVSPKLDVCETVEHVTEKRCFLTEALKRWWAKGSTANRQAVRATAGLEAERAALEWARQAYPTQGYRVRITNQEKLTGPGCQSKPREMTLVVESRDSDWLTRTRVMVSPGRSGWAVRKL